MNRRNRMACAAALLWAAIGMQAQNINGKLTDEQSQPMPYANVTLQTTDSTFVTGTTTGEKGDFKLQKVAPGNYRLVVTSIGYHPLYVDLQGFEASADLGTLTVAEAASQLQEVTVTASNMVSSVDKKMVFPNKKQVDASNSGIDLLRNLLLPRLNINPIDGSIGTTDGGTVQLCINGRKVTKEEANALLPNEIVRVEMLEEPGLRYGDAAVVVNYVVRRQQIGGSFGYNGAQSVRNGFGNHNANGKLNFGKSEISFYYGNKLEYFNELWYNKTETFVFEDGKQLNRVQRAETDGKKLIRQWGALTYNLQDGEKYMLNLSAGFSHYLDPALRMTGKLYSKEYPNSVTDRDEKKHERNLIPYLDLYFQRNLKNRQFLALNAVGTYINTRNRSNYAEYLNNEAVVDYFSGVNGKKYSLIAEAIYEKGFEKGGRLSAGVRHTQGYTNNEYEGTLRFGTQMRQADTYAYAQYGGKWKKLGYRLGMGVTRSWLHQNAQEAYETWSLNPRFNLNYTLNNQWSASLEGSVRSINPALSELSAADQLKDSLQIGRGNPNLKPYNYYLGNFRLNYNKGKWNVGAYASYNYGHKTIMPHIYRENNFFVQSYANHKNYQQCYAGLNARVGMLWNVLQLSGNLYTAKQWSNGIDYRHTDFSVGYSLSATLMYRNFTASAMYSKNTDRLFGETLYTGEEAHFISLQYRLKKLNVGVQMFNPFQNDYARTEANKNKYAAYDYSFHVDDVARMVCLTLSWNFSFGRDYKSTNKQMQNTDTDSGVLK